MTETEETTKSLTIKDLKAMAFDKMQQIKQAEQEYNAILQEIVNRNKEN